MHSTPLTRPTPVISDAAGTSKRFSPPYMPYAASCDSSRKRRARIDQRIDPFARQQFAACEVFLARRLGTAQGDRVDGLAQVVDHRLHGPDVGLK
ncbi:MAG: hypothetical protein IPN64_08940, partial [Propionivibrio sp.]|uniref:hypothetical protein n=1 Tax=Propionivibrio sp. TaxID=2212460 RepID=UPI0025D9ED7A